MDGPIDSQILQINIHSRQNTMFIIKLNSSRYCEKNHFTYRSPIF